MKKILSALCLTMLCCVLFCGCDNKDNHSVHISEQFVLLEEFDSKSGLCYDKDTMIIYIYEYDYTYYGNYVTTYTPYYVMDTNNNPTIAVYNGDLADE